MNDKFFPYFALSLLEDLDSDNAVMECLKFFCEQLIQDKKVSQESWATAAINLSAFEDADMTWDFEYYVKILLDPSTEYGRGYGNKTAECGFHLARAALFYVNNDTQNLSNCLIKCVDCIADTQADRLEYFSKLARRGISLMAQSDGAD